MAKPNARERILEAADRLFYADGLRAAGIDRVIAGAGGTKMTLYHHFPSKDQLIRATPPVQGIDAYALGMTAPHCLVLCPLRAPCCEKSCSGSGDWGGYGTELRWRAVGAVAVY